MEREVVRLGVMREGAKAVADAAMVRRARENFMVGSGFANRKNDGLVG
jgi:hypothetical protein